MTPSIIVHFIEWFGNGWDAFDIALSRIGGAVLVVVLLLIKRKLEFLEKRYESFDKRDGKNGAYEQQIFGMLNEPSTIRKKEANNRFVKPCREHVGQYSPRQFILHGNNHTAIPSASQEVKCDGHNEEATGEDSQQSCTDGE